MENDVIQRGTRFADLHIRIEREGREEEEEEEEEEENFVPLRRKETSEQCSAVP